MCLPGQIGQWCFEMTELAQKQRRARNNLWIGGICIGFVLLIFAITVAKMMSGHNMEAFDHTERPARVVSE